MRTHGWKGAPPADDDEARSRLIDASMRCITKYGPSKTSLSDVAVEAGVTRQTVYRYFSNIEELLIATGAVGAEPFLDRLTAHCAGFDQAAEILVEAMAYVIERLPDDLYLSLLLATGRSSLFAETVTSPMAMKFGRALLERFPVAWEEHGFADHELDELVEFMLRILQSFWVDPGRPPRGPLQLRSYLHRWVGPSISAQARAADTN